MEVIIVLVMVAWIAYWILKFYYQTIVPEKEKAAERKTQAYASYNDNNETLTLMQRTPKLEKALKIVEDVDVSTEYVPEKLHIGAATVGGITTGGTYTTGGYHNISGVRKNGLYRLEYAGKRVKKIKLTDSLYEQAKKSMVKEYLDESDKSIIVMENVPLSSIEAQVYLKMAATGASNKMFKKGYPTYEKCRNIVNWITL